MSFEGKVTVTKKPEVVYSKGKDRTLKKQDVTITDESGSCKAVLWESHVGVFSTGECYKFQNVRINAYNGCKYFSISANSASEKIEDIGDVVEDNRQENSGQVVPGEIVRVSRVENYKKCRVCNCKVIERTNMMAECPKCQARVKLSKCPSTTSACFVIEDQAGTSVHVTAFGNTLAEIFNSVYGEDIADKLINASKQNYHVNSRNIVTKVSPM